MAGLLIELIGWLAAGSTVAAYAMRTMLPLRLLAVISSVLFLLYGIATQSLPLVAMEITLLPLNVWRFAQLLSLRRRVEETRRSRVEEFSVLKAYSKGRDLPAGEVIFTVGDHADALYYIASGTVRIEEADAMLSKGQIFGEIGFFTDDAKRTATARVESDARIHRIDERTFLRLQFQDPAFGMAVMRTITRRLLDLRGTGLAAAAPTRSLDDAIERA